jgi:hypothetical protein
MSIKKTLFLPAMLAFGLLSVVTISSCNNEAEKPAATEEKKTEAAPAATPAPDTTAKPAMDTTAAQRPTKPGA